ncbi:50S ribosomal protein L30 [Sphingomonas sp. 7/4-4]|uniref:50S ribosomal protein L30 n=1 Tax=Sphingomonas sp. 7/4-4 TaxID=3018446 RepID=UPI0022F3802F|nr:50S ribosomal protein L30 [Sphingomonas sp. 7/4-4]WBY07731.1 50S ribosomal protein L30 [Sphingomonas sp. 7/4-4]
MSRAARCAKDQRATLVGAGLHKMHKVSELQDGAEVRGMIRKMQHMVEVVEG